MARTLVNFLGKKALRFLSDLGNITVFMFQVISAMFTSKRRVRRTLDQMLRLGIQSNSVAIMTAVFVGMTFALQVLKEFVKFGAVKMIGGVVALAVWRELGPLLTGVVVAGRVGAAISAELATMKVSEQVEAMEAMAQDPIEYLVVPRVIALSLMVPLLIGLADTFGFLSGLLVVVASGKVNAYSYFSSADSMLKVPDITGGLIKGVFFGFLIAVVSSYMGLKATGGAKGVGDMTTKAVVVSLITIFIVNYVLSTLLF